MGSGASRQRMLTGGNALDGVGSVMRDCRTRPILIVIIPWTVGWTVGGIRQEKRGECVAIGVATRPKGPTVKSTKSQAYTFFGKIQFRTGVGTELHA